MTYVTDQTSQELRTHMRRLKAMAGWHEPLADRLYKEILELDKTVSKLRAAQAAQPVQPEGWKLVPVEPTQAMVEAAGLDCVMGKSAWDVTTALWSAMLSAAPSTKEQSNG